ncbi:MAG TPA: FtsX-like permease family protein [Xanthobacteraceae bacterium]
MSTSERFDAMAQTWTDREVATSSEVEQRLQTPIVPSGSIAGRSLTAVVAIMTFLAALATGAVTMVMSAASDWQSDVAREVTIQVRPISGRDLEADVRSAVALARATAGIADVRAYTKEESAQLVEPWLGSGLQLTDLPIPRMVVVKLVSGAAPNFTDLRKQLADQVPSASLDDHRGWIARMRTMADTAVIAGLIMLVLVIVVTVLSVTFATRGAMATNRPTIEVLHYIGATDKFVAGQFQRHFLVLGLKGGAIGGGVAMALFGLLQALDTWLAGTPGGDEMTALFGSLSIGPGGYIAILVLIALMALVTALASRRTVGQTLQTVD